MRFGQGVSYLSIAMVRHLTRNTSLIQPNHFYRWHQSITRLCRDVRYATLSAVLGRRPSHGAKPTILYIAKRRLFDPDQGA